MNINEIKAALSSKAAAITTMPAVPVIKVPAEPVKQSSVITSSATVSSNNSKENSATKPENASVTADTIEKQSEKAEKKAAARKPRSRKATESKKAESVSTTTTTAPSIRESIESVVARLLMPNLDYGIIPGCRKPSLLKSGAEKLANYYGYSTSVTVGNRFEDYEKSLVAYEIKVTVHDANGFVVAEGIGAANSRERKFLRGDFYSQINTVFKMAKKRAYVDAILTASGASGIFTQDMEDIANAGNEHPVADAIG